ncbi:uncharacterized protein [Leuresthes tenuis]|uniref:uncharacterized protein isoform X2 n=1 Tax=Leuresthes tenuis TaxID=355514 RepID=UPI003B509A4E
MFCSERCYQSLILGCAAYICDTKELSGTQSPQICTEAPPFFGVFTSHPVLTDMSGNIIVVFALLAALLVSDAASSPETSAAGGDKETNVLQQLLAKREKARDSAGRLMPASRAQRRAHLSEDDREIMTKQIMQALSGMVCSQR